jgi:hypothetical protein
MLDNLDENILKYNISQIRENIVYGKISTKLLTLIILFYTAITVILHGLLGCVVFNDLPDIFSAIFNKSSYLSITIIGQIWLLISWGFGGLIIISTFVFWPIVFSMVSITYSLFIIYDLGLYLIGKENRGPFFIFGYVKDVLSTSSTLELSGFCVFSILSLIIGCTIGLVFVLVPFSDET